jgi:8-oxo-dGTP pyrophosphatase MutT (NUDIX family)
MERDQPGGWSLSLGGYAWTMPGPQDIAEVVCSHRCDGDEVSYQRTLDLVSAVPLAWARAEFEPGHFTASGFVASPDGGSLLLIHHAKLGRWLQPGGHFEAIDASVEDAARREVLEETGVGALTKIGSALVRIDAHPIPARGDEPGHTHFDLGVGFQASTTHIGPLDEVLDARWVRFEDLEAYEVDEALLGGARTLADSLRS